MSDRGDSPPLPHTPVPEEQPVVAVPISMIPPGRRGARMSVRPIHAPEDYFPPGVDQATIDWARRLQFQGFAPDPPVQPHDDEIAVEELAYHPDQPYDPFHGWQQELPDVGVELDDQEQADPHDDGYEADDEADDEEEDPEEEPEEEPNQEVPNEDNFWVADPAPVVPDVGIGAVMGLPAQPQIDQVPHGPEALPDFPPDTDMGEVVDPAPGEVLTFSSVLAQRDALLAQQGTDWVRIHELEGLLDSAEQQRDAVTREWAGERARAGRAEQAAAISGQAVRRMRVRIEEDASLAAREYEMSDEEFQARVEQMTRVREERRRRASGKAPVHPEWSEGTSRQGGRG